MQDLVLCELAKVMELISIKSFGKIVELRLYFVYVSQDFS